jgi:hypothetical protein
MVALAQTELVDGRSDQHSADARESAGEKSLECPEEQAIKHPRRYTNPKSRSEPDYAPKPTLLSGREPIGLKTFDVEHVPASLQHLPGKPS